MTEVNDEGTVKAEESTSEELKPGINPNGDVLIPKDAVSIHECGRCGCRVFQSCANVLIIDVNKAAEAGCDIPANMTDPINNGPYRLVQQDAGILVCAGCGRKYRSEAILIDLIKAKTAAIVATAPVSNATAPVNNIADNPTGIQPEEI